MRVVRCGDNGGTLHGRARRAVCNDGEYCDHMSGSADIGSGTRTQDGRTHQGEDRLRAKNAANLSRKQYCKMRCNGGQFANYHKKSCSEQAAAAACLSAGYIQAKL